MATTQWIAFSVLMVVIALVVYLFARKGSDIKSDAENKGRSDQGHF